MTIESVAVRVAKRFSASPERVFDAWIDAGEARKWLFATPTGQMVRAETDPRVGGSFTFVDRREGEDVEHVGEYVEIDRPRLLVFTFTVPKYSKESTRVTIDFDPHGAGCDLVLTHEGVLPEYMSRTEDGWNAMLDALDVMLSDSPGSDATDLGHIRHVIDDWGKAIRAKDSKRLMSNFAPDAVLFDLINPLQYIGADAARQRADEWLSSFRGPIGYETRDLRIATSDDVAFCHSLNGVSGTKTDGTKVDMWWRTTVCFRKISGKWMVTHEHSSVPFDMGSGRASLDLKP